MVSPKVVEYKGSVTIVNEGPHPAVDVSVLRQSLRFAGLRGATYHNDPASGTLTVVVGGKFSYADIHLCVDGILQALEMLAKVRKIKSGDVRFAQHNEYLRVHRVGSKWNVEKGTVVYADECMTPEEIARRTALCHECGNELCDWSINGRCMYPMSTGNPATVSDDGICEKITVMSANP